jgi:hypothetical protein
MRAYDLIMESKAYTTSGNEDYLRNRQSLEQERRLETMAAVNGGTSAILTEHSIP